MFISVLSLLLGAVTLVSLVDAQVDPELTGTWTTKSRKVFTGPVGRLQCFFLSHNQTFLERVFGVVKQWRWTYIHKGFYDPINDKFIEPAITGFSYSFTDEGHFEVAYYRAISNRMLL